ncbi:unnamed protein product [Caenorhabditis angaria]|uniref:Uncharacterized protein n=1 Tax=Caenorhabditis angaria TaxID=860376 RepID=A0A9P1IG18_9PELO|nr:unnamed protein product [Caenorhabditis angaria]
MMKIEDMLKEPLTIWHLLLKACLELKATHFVAVGFSPENSTQFGLVGMFESNEVEEVCRRHNFLLMFSAENEDNKALKMTTFFAENYRNPSYDKQILIEMVEVIASYFGCETNSIDEHEPNPNSSETFAKSSFEDFVRNVSTQKNIGENYMLLNQLITEDIELTLEKRFELIELVKERHRDIAFEKITVKEMEEVVGKNLLLKLGIGFIRCSTIQILKEKMIEMNVQKEITGLLAKKLWTNGRKSMEFALGMLEDLWDFSNATNVVKSYARTIDMTLFASHGISKKCQEHSSIELLSFWQMMTWLSF